MKTAFLQTNRARYDICTICEEHFNYYIIMWTKIFFHAKKRRWMADKIVEKIAKHTITKMYLYE